MWHHEQRSFFLHLIVIIIVIGGKFRNVKRGRVQYNRNTLTLGLAHSLHLMIIFFSFRYFFTFTGTTNRNYIVELSEKRNLLKQKSLFSVACSSIFVCEFFYSLFLTKFAVIVANFIISTFVVQIQHRFKCKRRQPTFRRIFSVRHVWNAEKHQPLVVKAQIQSLSSSDGFAVYV